MKPDFEKYTGGKGNVVLAAGGTAGHVFPAANVAAQLKIKGFNPVIIGSRLNQFNNQLHQITRFDTDLRGFDRKNPLNNLKVLRKLARNFFRVRIWIKEIKPICVISFGGYDGFLPGLLAVINRIPLFIIDLDAKAGLTNSILAHAAAKRFSVAKHSGREKSSKVTQIAVPVKREFFSVRDSRSDPNIRAEVRKSLDFSQDKFVIVLIGGSLGAEEINQHATFLANQLDNNYFEVILFEGLLNKPSTYPSNLKVLSFSDELYKAYIGADLVIARSGASSTREIEISRIPAILIPLSRSPRQHQLKNAERLKRLGIAEIFNGNSEELLDMVKEIREGKRLNFLEQFDPVESVPGEEVIVDQIVEIVNTAT